MARHYDKWNQINDDPELKQKRHDQAGYITTLKKIFDHKTLLFLEEKILDHLVDEVILLEARIPGAQAVTDFSFLMAPAYKALEGFLFQLAKGLELPSGSNPENAGGYFANAQTVDKHIDGILKELDEESDKADISDSEQREIKFRLSQMGSFLNNYRNSPAHFNGDPVKAGEKAAQLVTTIFEHIDSTTKVLLATGFLTCEEKTEAGKTIWTVQPKVL
ncbi:hypothetical protein K9M41_00245 [Candidatus Gracilibacteria bacterium]|nr:hypothetical protein [Candidatus Gracilibacteria bacterium]